VTRSKARHEQLRQLWQDRFAATPFDCTRDTPGIDEMPEWRDWSEIETTADQRRIESALEGLDVDGRKILHIGVGNSKLAQRFASRAAYILGTTICEAEHRRAESLRIPNYDVVVHNKYAKDRVRGRTTTFDFIIDNNPTTFCCCWMHLVIMMEHYAGLLSPTGRILTDKVGLSWVTSDPTANPRWSCSYEDWQAIGRPFNLEAGQLNDDVYTLSPRSTLRRVTRYPSRWARYLVNLLRLDAQSR
jgi:hypothetical protein